MSSASHFITIPRQFCRLIGSADAPTVIDVCRRQPRESAPGVPGQGVVAYDALFARARHAAGQDSRAGGMGAE
jgi:hypothetical protein